MMVLSHRLLDKGVTKKLGREYNANTINKYLTKTNPSSFPMPVSRVKKDDGSFDIVELTEIEGQPRLERDEVIAMYNKVCGRELHADHEYTRGELAEFRERISAINLFAVRLIKTLQEHMINLDNHYVIHAICSGIEKKGPSAKILRRQPKKSFYLREPT